MSAQCDPFPLSSCSVIACLAAILIFTLCMHVYGPRTVKEGSNGNVSWRRLSTDLLHDRAFQNGRTIANAGALEAIFNILQRENSTAAAAGHPELVAAVCGAMRRIAVNDEICTEFADLGGLAATMQVPPQSLLNTHGCVIMLEWQAESDSVVLECPAGKMHSLSWLPTETCPLRGALAS